MRKRFASGVVAAVIAVAFALPTAGVANKGGHPHSKKPCPTNRHPGKHKGASKGKRGKHLGATKGKHKGAGKGKKCRK